MDNEQEAETNQRAYMTLHRRTVAIADGKCVPVQRNLLKANHTKAVMVSWGVLCAPTAAGGRGAALGVLQE